MKRGNYLNSVEFEEILILASLASHCGDIAKKCTDAQWRRWLKTADTYATKVIEERVLAMDRNQRKGLKRRAEHSRAVVIPKSLIDISHKEGKKIILDIDDFWDIIDLSLNSCYLCGQGDKVKGCKFKALFLRLGVPVAREDVEVGECPYRNDNEIRCVNPDGKEIHCNRR